MRCIISGLRHDIIVLSGKQNAHVRSAYAAVGVEYADI